jgi:hypothetical protein
MDSASVPPLDPPDVRRVATLAGGIDPRTVATYLDGTRKPFRTTRAAIERALRRIKRADLIRCPECDYERRTGKVGPYERHSCDVTAAA